MIKINIILYNNYNKMADLPEFPAVPNGDPLLAAPVVLNNREVSTLINLEKPDLVEDIKHRVLEIH